MDEMDLVRFRYGGVNITGFRLIDPDQPAVQAIRREWRRVNHSVGHGTGSNSLQVLLSVPVVV